MSSSTFALRWFVKRGREPAPALGTRFSSMNARRPEGETRPMARRPEPPRPWRPLTWLRLTGFALRCSGSPRQEESQNHDVYQCVKRPLRLLLTPRKTPGKQASCPHGQSWALGPRFRENRSATANPFMLRGGRPDNERLAGTPDPSERSRKSARTPQCEKVDKLELQSTPLPAVCQREARGALHGGRSSGGAWPTRTRRGTGS